ncbi:uncharacterized protein [Miscanthus floridulus]|uniref:uncharacterized protein n=1 Tax=Miscanthus floridulus TaxID=154761 RepID=UPI00345911E2
MPEKDSSWLRIPRWRGSEQGPGKSRSNKTEIKARIGELFNLADPNYVALNAIEHASSWLDLPQRSQSTENPDQLAGCGMSSPTTAGPTAQQPAVEEPMAGTPPGSQQADNQTPVPEQNTSAPSTNPDEAVTTAPRELDLAEGQQPKVARNMVTDATARGKAVVVVESANAGPDLMKTARYRKRCFDQIEGIMMTNKELMAEVERLRRQLEAADQERTNQEAQNQNLVGQLQSKEQEKTGLEAEVTRLQGENSCALAECGRLKEDNEKLARRQSQSTENPDQLAGCGMSSPTTAGPTAQQPAVEEPMAGTPPGSQQADNQTPVPEQNTSAPSTNPDEAVTTAPRELDLAEGQQPKVARNMVTDATARGKAVVVVESANAGPDLMKTARYRKRCFDQIEGIMMTNKELMAEVERLRRQLEAADQERTNQEAQNQNLVGQLQSKEQEKTGLEAEVTRLQGENSCALAECGRLKEDNEKLVVQDTFSLLEQGCL